MTGEVATSMPAAFGHPDDDPTARLGALFDSHHQRLFRLARRLSRNREDACDLVQETFLRAARAPGSVPSGPTSEEAWLVRVLINISRDRWRSAGVRQRRVEGHTAEPLAPSSPEEVLIARTMVQDALQRLPPRRRAILVLYELEGTEISKIAELLGVSAVTVRWHLSVGRRKMAQVLGARRPR